METRYTVRQASEMTGVKPYVMRYWEDELDLHIQRNELGHRYYTRYDIQLFLNIRELKKRGLQLRAIKDLIPQIARTAPGSSDSKIRLLEEAGHVDILCNNAGMQFRKNAFEYPEEMFDKVIAVNLKAPYRLSQKAAIHFRDQGLKGKIINTASLFTTFGGVEVSGYTCSKHGVMGMTRALSNEFAPYGICVNAIAPGYIATELTKAIWSDSKRRQPMDERIPAGRWGTPDDFEGPAVFLASRASDYITGIMIPIDGGYSAR